MIRAVLFDIGSTLWSSPAEDPDGLARVYGRARDVLLETTGSAPALDVLVDAVEGYLAEWEDTWSQEPGLTIQRPTTGFIADALARLDIEVEDVAALQRFTDEVMEASVYTAKAVPEEEGMEDALERLRDLDLRLACVSNAFMSGATLMRILEARGLGKHLEFVISSAETGIRKPDEAIYLTAVNRLGLAPEEVVYVGDRVSADIEGPGAIGMPGILTHQYRREDPAAARIAPAAVIAHLRDLADAIRRLNGEGR